MKKYFFSTLFLNLLTLIAAAQLSLQTTIPPVGLIQKSQLWNVLVINSSASSYECKLNLLLKDRFTGQDVLAASSASFVVGAGAKQLNSNIISPIQYNSISLDLDAGIQGLIPAGSYMACYTLSLLTDKIDLAEECVQFDVEPLTLPMLIFPTDSSELVNAPTQFSWTPPTPSGMVTRLHYEILITEINEGQKAEEAIQQNLPFYSNGNVFMNVLNYPGTSQNFHDNKWYAWQIIAKDDKSYTGKSEVWVFSINTPPIVQTIIEQTPYLKMKKTNPQKGIAPNGILKLSYINETADSIAHIKIKESYKKSQNSIEIKVSIRPGENLIQYNLNNKMQLREGEVYEAQIINSRQEKWVMEFEFKNYKGKNESNN